MEKLRLLHGPQIQEALKEEEIEAFGYRLNRAGLYLLIFVAVIFYGLAGTVWFQTSLTQTVWAVAFFALLAAGVAISLTTAYWHNFANQHFVALSDDFLFVGDTNRAWGIAWELLDKKSLGFEDMELSRLGGKLNIQVGGEDVTLHLFNAFVILDDIQRFMMLVLERLKE